MYKLKFYFTAVMATVWTSFALAGAVSGGGGGTTNPEPADPEWIVSTTIHDAGIILVSWLNMQEDRYEQLSEQEKLKSPYLKIFRSEKNIFEIIQQTSIELRMSEPCYDAAGEARDGSIYARKPGGICISPFTMAPKLSEYNFKQETVALIVHELAHIMGADEPEAKAIQQYALWSFNRIDFLDVVVSIDLLAKGSLGGKIQEAMMELDWWIQSPETTRSSDLSLWLERLTQLRTDLDFDHKEVRFLRTYKYKKLTPLLAKVQAVIDFTCANDPREDQSIKEFCAEQLQKGYGADSAVTSRQFVSRRGNLDPGLLGPEYDEVILQKITGASVVSLELKDIKTYLQDAQQALRALKNFRIDLYRTP